MPADILALETLYGLPTSTPLSGGQTFGFNCNISGAIEPYFDFAINTKPIITIWDEGKNNTLDLSGFSASSAVNLNPGTFSSCDGLTNNLAIAYNTVIDSFIGSSGNDTVVGNNDGDSINAGAGNDTITGGSGNDTFIVGAGNDTLKGGAGNDMFNLGANLIAADKIDGGSGTDTVYLNGNYTGAHAMTFNATTMVHVEKIVLAAGHSYTLTTDDATVAACKTLTIDGSALTGSNVLTFNGSAETDGKFVIISGHGADNLTGGAGADTFTYWSATRSTGTHYDTITGFNFSNDIFDIPGGAGTITGIDTKVTSGSLSTASFDTDLAAAMSGHLGAHHAILFKPNAGTFSGDTFLVVDLNGTAGYQCGHDLVIRMKSSTGTLAAAGFH
jgi:Ca2+-binding RTX toxin-like protein